MEKLQKVLDLFHIFYLKTLLVKLKFVKSNWFTFASLIEVIRSLLHTSRVNQLLLTDFNNGMNEIQDKVNNNNETSAEYAQ